jgi:hypothetical protein
MLALVPVVKWTDNDERITIPHIAVSSHAMDTWQQHQAMPTHHLQVSSKLPNQQKKK